MAEEIILGMPHIRGNSDTIMNALAPTDVAGNSTISAGTTVTIGTDGMLAPFTGTGVLFGVAGYGEANKKQSVIREGLQVGVILAAGATPAIGKPAYVDATGKFTDATSGTATAGIFASAILQGRNVRTNAVVNAALLDFAGGL